ncbi:MAG: molybdate ABC transporter permease subunit [Cyanobacteria bacterium NC_groundwater_1444_Ag_S-0.65um_54_12]|nr:molybdate ABC transporter permease subunit [Cyanobacteria bacterium NC_groundwater_1444_Ag_S-0.65um_54_12]
MGPLLLSLKLALVTTGILLLIGVLLAYWLAFSRWRWKVIVEAIIALPLVLPPTVLGFYLLLFIGQNGWLGRIWETLFKQSLAFSFEALVLASICYSLPFAVQPLQASLQGIDPRLLEASFTLGASRWRTFFQVVLPNALPGLWSAIVLSFTHTLGEFGVVLMVGGNIPGQTRTVSIAIYDLVEALEYQQANHLSLILLALSYAVLVLFYFNNRKAFQLWQRS